MSIIIVYEDASQYFVDWYNRGLIIYSKRVDECMLNYLVKACQVIKCLPGYYFRITREHDLILYNDKNEVVLDSSFKDILCKFSEEEIIRMVIGVPKKKADEYSKWIGI